ncbi:hypothetical protein SAMN02910356_00931 [Selenomonas sp. GACV-9]|uniref:hypothetical protein n=1 Tax=Selenomonas sp. GACV-9 TaxID=3158782 RepID=UPI0008EBE4AC|nr:hypothetical protein SAMN02910356_00931 [Selenomonas ruminantium]
MEKTLIELCSLCNSMNGLQREIESMEECLERLDERLEYSMEHRLHGAGLFSISMGVYKNLF